MAFPDFFRFARVFERHQSKGDLNGDGQVDCSDFVAFTQVFGLSAGPQVVTFADWHLESLVRWEIGKSKGDIFLSDVLTLTSLRGNEWSITNLDGIQHLTSLTELELAGNFISDLSPLAELHSLSFLDLSSNRINDLVPLASADSLTAILLEYNQISDLSALVVNPAIGSGVRLELRGNPLSVTALAEQIPQLEARGAQILIDPYYSLSGHVIAAGKRPSGVAVDLRGDRDDRTVTNDDGFYCFQFLPRGGSYTVAPVREGYVFFPDSLDVVITGTDVTGRNFRGEKRVPDTRATLIATVTQDGDGVAGLKVMLSRSISGRPPEYIWQGTTDADGHTQIEIVADASMFWRSGVSGYYTAVAIDPVSGRTVGRWESIPISGGGEVALLLSVEGQAQINRRPKVITFADRNLDAVVRWVISKPEGDIFASDVRDLTVLNAGNYRIARLDGIENLTSLVELRLDQNVLTDISPIAGLSILSTLNLAGNRVTDISSLSRLTLLDSLGLSENDIEVVAPLSGLTVLRDLSLAGNRIVDLFPLGALSALERLDASRNRIRQATLPPSLTSLQGVNLSKNEIAEVSLTGLNALAELELSQNLIQHVALTHLVHLQDIDLSHNRIVGVSLSDLPELSKLNLSENQMTEIALSNLASLGELDLSQNRILDVRLSDLPRMQMLDLSQNQIVEISLRDHPAIGTLDLSENGIERMSFSGLVSLKTLDLSHNQVEDVSQISGLPGLKYLNLSHNRIQDVTSLSEFSLRDIYLAYNQISDISAYFSSIEEWRIRTLDLSHNQISDISAFSGVDSLRITRRLDLSYNQISDISGLSDYFRLKSLNLSHNQISDISALGLALYGLNHLDLSYNQISDISQLTRVTAFDPGDTIGLQSNPLDADATTIHIPVLVDQGVIVSFGEATAANGITSLVDQDTNHGRLLHRDRALRYLCTY